MLEHQENLTELAGKKVVDWDPVEGLQNLAETAYRVRYTDTVEAVEGLWHNRFAALLQDPAVNELTGLVVGAWSDMMLETRDAEEIIDLLIEAHTKLPKLQALFLNDIISEEHEISWLAQSDISQLLKVYPKLEYLGIRGGGDGLHLGEIRLEHLRTLIIESGGLPREVVLDVLRADLPQLEHLEIWIGDLGYGATTTVEDLAPLLRKDPFPNLRYLGLRNSEIANDIASVIAFAPLLDHIETLDLSLGVLTDVGARALLQSPAIHKLKKLDLHYHYCSNELMLKLTQLPIEVDISGAQDHQPGGRLYVSIGE